MNLQPFLKNCEISAASLFLQGADGPISNSCYAKSRTPRRADKDEKDADMILREVASLVKVSFVTLRARWRYTQRYRQGNVPWDTGVSPPELLAYLKTRPPGRALDMGCGTGTNAITLARHGWEVYAIDFSAPAIRTARRKARRAGVSAHFYRRSVADTGDLPAPFDLILDIGCYHGLHPAIQAQYAANLKRLLAPGGTLLMYAHLRQAGASPDYGLDENGLHLLTEHVRLIQRTEGRDHRGRASAWLVFRTAPTTS